MFLECPSCGTLSPRAAHVSTSPHLADASASTAGDIAVLLAPAPDLLSSDGLTICPTCDDVLERSNGRSFNAALACSLATFLLLIPSNFLPFATTSALSATRTSHIISGVWAMFRDGWGPMGVVIGLFAILAPFARFALLIAVLGSLRLGHRPPWLGKAFRWADSLQTYAMSDVMLLALWVSFARLAATVSIKMEMGGYCFVLAGLCTLYTRAVLDRSAVWEAILPAPETLPAHPLACLSCELVTDGANLGAACARCERQLLRRKRQSVSRAAALTFAGLLFYIPANLYPMATLPIGLKLTAYTVFGGVVDLVEAHLIGLAALVFVASFAVPFLKLAGLGWCIWAVVRRSKTHLKLRTRVFRVVDEIGRWSMLDPFVIATFVPLTQFNTATASRAEPAAPAFTAVVVLTVIAARCFDPRLMWDAAK